MISGSSKVRQNLLFIGAFLFATWICCIITQNEARHVNNMPAELDPERPGQVAPNNADEAWKLCSAFGFRPHSSRSERPRRVYDLFPLNAELEWLTIRLNQLDADVDYFVIVESPTTVTGLEKPLYLEQNWANYTQFHHKIIRKAIPDPGAQVGSNTRKREEYMRNALFTNVFPELDKTEKGAQEGDVLIVGDVDELPRPETLKALRYCDFPDRTTLRSATYFYSFQWLVNGDQWPHPQATSFHGLTGTILPSNLRKNVGSILQWLPWRLPADMPNAAWHCSHCFETIREVRIKMEAAVDTYLNREHNRQPGHIVARTRDGFDLFGRKDVRYEKMFINPDTPRYIGDHSDKYKFLYNREGLMAGYNDSGEWNMTLVPDKGQRGVGQGEFD